MAKDDHADLIAVLMSAHKKQEQAKLEQVSKYQSLDELLEFLADATPAKRENFLKSWKTKNAAKGSGRPRKDDFKLFRGAWILRHKYEAQGKKFRGWRDFFIQYMKDTRPEMDTDAIRKEAEKLKHKISRIESKMKKNN